MITFANLSNKYAIGSFNDPALQKEASDLTKSGCSTSDIITAVKKSRFSTTEFCGLLQLGYWDRMPGKWKERHDMLFIIRSAKLLGFLQKGLLIFNTKTDFLRWLERKQDSFGGKSPKQLMENYTDFNFLESALMAA